MLETICKKCGAFKCPKVFLYDNESEFKTAVTKLLEKHNVDFEEQQQNIKHIHTAFVEAIKELALFWVHEMYTFYKVLFISINGNLISINGNLIKL